MKKFITHPNLITRFLSLLIIGLVLFLLSWFIGYYLLPEGILQGKTASSQLAGDGASPTLVREFVKIASINMVLSLLIIGANYCLKINQVPLGYQIPIIWFIMYGITLGTNSFLIPLVAKMAPSLEVFHRSGVYELTAYTLIAAATFKLSRYEVKRIFKTNPERIPAEQTKLNKQEWLAVLIAYMVLFGSNYWEARMILRVLS